MGMDFIVRTILDVTVCTHSRGGVGRWVKGLSGGLYQVNRGHLSIDAAETHSGLVSEVADVSVLKQPLWMKLPLLRRIFLNRGLLESTRSSRIEKQFGLPDVIHLSGVQPEGNAKRRVVTFFDDTPWTSPESHTKDTLVYAGRMKKLIESGASVLTISRWAQSAAQRLFSIPPERTGCAGGAAEELFSPGEPDRDVMENYKLKPREYFLHVGSFVPRKNIPFLVRCFNEAGTGKTLVLAGAEKWGSAEADNSPNVLFLNSISDHDLLSLYRGAAALLLPSSSEGLGLPVLEAFACGTPVVSSDGGALKETVGENGLVLPVLAKEPWVRAIRETASGTVSDNLRRRAEEAAVPSWREVGENAMEFYRSIL